MASATKQTSFRRMLRVKNMNRKAKNLRENRGSTPKFPIHTPEIDAAAPSAQVSPKK